ncbi:MAG: hypothetical protein NC078_04535 [Ruminococcus sp.]|nr:hypothetical protein [Ruminococcus sp.]
MKKNVLAAMAAVMMVMGGCGSVSGDGTETADWGGEIMGSEEVVSLAESMAESMVESMLDEAGESGSVTEVTRATRAVTTEKETSAEELAMAMRSSGYYLRTSEEESKTVTIDSEVYPYDSEEIKVFIETDYSTLKGIEPYNCIDLENLKNYPDLKKLHIGGNMYDCNSISLINLDSAAGLENLEEIEMWGVVWDKSQLAEIDSLKKLYIGSCQFDDWSFLADLKQVEILELSRNNVSDLSFVNGMSSLGELKLSANSIDNSGLYGIEENHTLKKLIFSENCAYSLRSDSTFEYLLTDITGLSRFKGLAYLEISEFYLLDKEQQEEYIREQLPECEVWIL